MPHDVFVANQLANEAPRTYGDLRQRVRDYLGD
jgi:hypothetical protein